MINTFVPMIEQFYSQMDHEQSMKDYQKDKNELFKDYFEYCDENGDGKIYPGRV